MSRQLPPLSFVDLHALDVSSEILDACAALFSSDYGIWSQAGPRPGHNVELSARALRASLLFDPDTCRLAVAKTLAGEVIGQAFYCNFPYKPAGQRVVWITQLVVKTEYRGQHIARKLLRSACGDHGLFACCLVSCNPIAVMALCSAVGSDPNLVATAVHIGRIVKASGVPYIQGRPITINSEYSCSKMATAFHVCHPEMIPSHMFMRKWKLGSVLPGEEFVAVIFPPGTHLSSDR